MGYGVIPDKHELEAWLRAGVTPREASERYAARGLHVSPGAISTARHRYGWPRFKMSHEGLIPWKVAPQHVRLHDHRMLSEESRRRQGAKLRPLFERQLDSWLRRLDEEGAVVHYDADTDQGWWWVDRRRGVDTDIIRVPDTDSEADLARLRRTAIPLFLG